MKEYVNGEYLDISPEREAEIKRQQEEFEKWLAENPPVPSPEERIAILEAENKELKQTAEENTLMLAELIGGIL